MSSDLTPKIKFRLNGIDMEKEVPAGWTLLRYLREELGLTGTKCGCEIGECGACTVLMNGKPVNSCLVMAPQIENASIWTIEGVTPPGGTALHPVQKAFIECDAVHCGFCTPGMVMTTIGLLLQNKKPDNSQIKQALAGNLCRCTGYIQIFEAVRLAAAMISENDMRPFRENISEN
ncbi:MAG: (2Fe-2S)-binding protein [candidate division Zixibacteria bacterium]|jgi:carbon-monoxide dehydrogenase small subunit|nr:(2Fe-2S)-binding protein [candidate division Zixibacteria bacterium]